MDGEAYLGEKINPADKASAGSSRLETKKLNPLISSWTRVCGGLTVVAWPDEV